jgi:lipoprotein-anchoring transpeptidase ErfK/SrfK
VLAAVAAESPSPAWATTVSKLYATGSDVAVPYGPTLLRAAPDSDRVVGQVAPRTMFGSRTRLAVVDESGEWLEVISENLANDVHGFIRRARVQITHDPYSLEVDRSAKQLTVWRLGVRLRRIGVAIGTPSTPTPRGRYAITDKLRDFFSQYYGCCAIALSGHQTRETPNWAGGDRLAIHAGSGIGSAVSNGCLRAATSSMRYLMRVLPVGTQLIVHD